ncbi:hypothetical protein CLAFUW4_07422 [Fulvia fulva]|uniref:Uncharacterized protein n=1 Tax=Passalora fulva TaxID=5499 RepID=A0A9Q8PA35_PASFU|nr:uncharacterized protein CLAFUR5_07552 [Fulvia fulva]KAK4621849.1 hypothetical protein CLAFUR4_07429 [Fulvia fulva]UJO18680.1 hypothetical protein CLAFUR5_07552 [Fulvia fulva]WPV16711.1 hypothetical protein CLAFUW4_07422 [Fulvia fulva]WPV30917.1 hypothetical protein CLAFUW7_07425 [Fulvia fulva]
MLDTGAPPDSTEHEHLGTVSLLSSHHASTSSTPGLSSLDGTSRRLYSLSLPPRSHSAPPAHDMAIKPTTTRNHDQGTDQHSQDSQGSKVTVNHNASFETVTSLDCHPHHVPDDKSPPQMPLPELEQRTLPPLSEISRLLRLQKYHKRRCYHAEDKLHQLQIAAAKTSRLVHSAGHVQHILAECIRSEDKNSFATLLHAFQDACGDALHSEQSAPVDAPLSPESTSRCSTPFLQDLSSSSKLSILDFLSKIRYNGRFLADRLASLTHKELVSLLPDRTSARPQESVFGGSARSNSRLSKPLGIVVDAQIEIFFSFAFNSPIETLIFSTRGIPGADRLDDHATQIWADVCARLVFEQKPGSERVVPAVLDIWSSSLPWPGKDRLETWILQTLQRGSFLLEQPNNPSFRARMSGRSDVSPEEEMRSERYFSEAADSLLELLSDQTGPSIIPPGALKLCHAVWGSLNEHPGHQRAFPQFVLVRWLFHTFCQDAITLPESHVILTDHYVSEGARHRILREVVSRAQKSVFDVAYSWKYNLSPPVDTVRRIQSLQARFQGSDAVTDRRVNPSKSLLSQNVESFVVVSPRDIAVCLNALYPPRRPASVASDRDSTRSGVQSSASSMSGFSLFGHTRTPEPFSEVTTSGDLDDHYPRSLNAIAASIQAEHAGESLIEAQMREVCLELEDLLRKKAGTNSDPWDVLVSQSPKESLCAIKDAAARICADVHTESLLRRSPGHAKIKTREYAICRKAVEAILRDREAITNAGTSASVQHTPEGLASIVADLQYLYGQSIQDCEARLDFVQAHSLFQQLQGLLCFVYQSAGLTALGDVLLDIEHFAHKSVSRAQALSEACEAWANALESLQQLLTGYLEPLITQHDLLRDKMWYVAEVRTSAAYEEARSIATALRVMGSNRKNVRTRLGPVLRHWSGTKLASTNLHLKTEAQVLEILSARSDHGGPNKLSDDQSRATQMWMDRQNVDNLCRGEERLHRLCMEVRKCVDTVTAVTDTSNIWHSSLFAHDPSTRLNQQLIERPSFITGLYDRNGHSSLLSLRSQPRSNDTLSSATHTLSSASSRDCFDSRSPTLTHTSSVPFWSPTTTEVDSPSSATSIGSVQAQSILETSMRKRVAAPNVSPSPTFVDKLRQRVTSLVLSDLTTTLFTDGSETDHAFWTGLGFDLTDRHFRGLQALNTSAGSQTPTVESQGLSLPLMSRFDFNATFAAILQRFAVKVNPSAKLACLHDLDRLLVPYMAEQTAMSSPATTFRPHVANGVAVRGTNATEMSIRGFRILFSRSSLRPATIFRDLQYIAALLPSSVLQNTAEGKAFCNAAVAISGLKQEARKIMVETADSIIAYHSNNREHGRSSSTAQQQRDSATFSAPSRTPSAEEVARYSMADAAYLLQIAAKEGDTVAQRELGILYLTHPELMDRIIAPLTKPRDVFKEELEGKWRRNQDLNRCDPQAMCIAYHWMELSSKGGDSLAKEYLRQREEMDSF